MKKLGTAALAGTIGAVIAVAITFLIGDAVSGPLMATSPGADVAEPVALGAALGGTVVGGIAGLVLAAVLGKLTGRADAAFIGLCLIGLIVYGVFTFGATEDVAAGVWLNIMHVAAAIPIVGLLAKELGNARPS